MEVITKLYGPVLLAIILVTILLKRKLQVTNKTIPIELFGAIRVELPVWSPLIVRVLLGICVILSLLIYSVIDYSTLFPKELSMEVYYDEEGIAETMNNIPRDELDKFKVSADFSIRDSIYFKNLDLEIKKFKIADSFFCNKKASIHSTGQTTFKVLPSTGVQHYRIYEAKGELTHLLECPGQNEITIKSFFERIPTHYDYISPSLGKIIIKPVFKQTIAENNTSKGIIFHHTLHGLSVIKIFPYPSYDRTLYLFSFKDSLYAIGYAVYIQ